MLLDDFVLDVRDALDGAFVKAQSRNALINACAKKNITDEAINCEVEGRPQKASRGAILSTGFSLGCIHRAS